MQQETPKIDKVQDFLINNPNFQENRYHERFGHTTIRGGFLRRIS